MGILALIAEFENDIRRERGIKGALAHLVSWNVRFGSEADILIGPRHVRFTLNNGRWAAHIQVRVWLSVYEYTP